MGGGERERLKKYVFETPKPKGKKPIKGKKLHEEINPTTPVTPVTPAPANPDTTSDSSEDDSPHRVLRKYCFKNPFLNINDDGIETTKRPFPGPPQPKIISCASRLNKDFEGCRQILGQGNFSYCQKVFHRLDGCYYALKISHKQYDLLNLEEDSDVQRAQAEIQAMAYLGNHKNLVGYHGAWFEQKRLHIQMEFCEGTLENKSLKGGFTSELDFQSVLYHVAMGLDYIHKLGVIHLDIKPANILVKGSVYKIGDFGLAGFADEQIDVNFYQTAGDGRYMPINYDVGDYTKADIFALGISIYEIILRHLIGEPIQEEIEMPRSQRVQLQYIEGFSDEFINLLQDMVQDDPDLRPSAEEILADPVLNAARFLYDTQ